MKITELVNKLVALQEKDPDAVVDVVGYSTLLVKGKDIEVPIVID